jgi:Flp pilus assembly protein TadG
MKKQGGQDFVEFALVLPLFVLFLMGIVYGGLLYGDFVSYNNWVRSAAREAAIEERDPDGTYGSLQKDYLKRIQESDKNTNLYIVKNDDFKIDNVTTDSHLKDGKGYLQVRVTLKLSLNDNGNGLVETLKSWPDKINMVKDSNGQLRTFTIVYYMYEEIQTNKK